MQVTIQESDNPGGTFEFKDTTAVVLQVGFVDDVHVVVQFYPLFIDNCYMYFLLIGTHYYTLTHTKPKENKYRTKDA